MCTCPSSPLEVVLRSSTHSNDDATAIAVVAVVTTNTTIVTTDTSATAAVCNTIAAADRKGFHSLIPHHRTLFHRAAVIIAEIAESKCACCHIETSCPCFRGRCKRR